MPDLNRDVINGLFEEWDRHANLPEVRFNSDPRAILDCNAYRRLVGLGFDVLPFLEGKMHGPYPIIASQGIPALIRDLVGDDYRIPPELAGNLSAIRDFTIEWLQGRY